MRRLNAQRGVSVLLLIGLIGTSMPVAAKERSARSSGRAVDQADIRALAGSTADDRFEEQVPSPTAKMPHAHSSRKAWLIFGVVVAVPLVVLAILFRNEH